MSDDARLKRFVEETPDDMSPVAFKRSKGLLAPPKMVLLPYSDQWEASCDRERKFVYQALCDVGLGGLCVALPDSHRSLLPASHPNDGSPIPIGSTTIKGIELASPFCDSALMVNCSPWDLPDEFCTAMRRCGYVCVGRAPHVANGEDQWWMRISPGPNAPRDDSSWSAEERARNTEEHDGFDIHVVGPAAHDFVTRSLAFARYLEAVPDARQRYVAYKRQHACEVAVTGKEAEVRSNEYKKNKHAVCAPMVAEAMVYAERELLSN